MRAIQGCLAAAVAVCSCSKARPQQGTLANPVSWEEDISSVFAAQCNSCHSGPNPAAGYRTTSYLEALGPTNAPVAVPGDTSSKLLSIIDPAKADAEHAPVSGAFAQVQQWVVPGRLSFFRSGIHEGGILNPNDPEFHKFLVRDRGWNFSDCQSCHGTDLNGGKAAVSCNDCHALQVGSDGVPSCTSCHGSAQTQSPAPPRDLTGNTTSTALGVGAHQAHLFGKVVITARIDCSTCHQVPAAVDSPGHLDTLRPAEVIFSGLAIADSAQPAWNRVSCSATYCHGGGTKLANDTAAGLQTPAWTLDGTQVFCGSCHGLPPVNGRHPGGISFPNCSGCHPKTVTPGGAIIVSGPPEARTSFHINGVVDVGP
jgi:predicted CxxxxCH...CXXCH cytochrome family protein